MVFSHLGFKAISDSAEITDDFNKYLLQKKQLVTIFSKKGTRSK